MNLNLEDIIFDGEKYFHIYKQFIQLKWLDNLNNDFSVKKDLINTA